MVFSSLPFLFGYLPVVLAVLKLAPLHARNFCLFLVSLIFYGWSEPVYIVIMLISTFVDYYNGRMVDKYRDDRKKAKRFVWFSVIFNLSLLGFFKYADFFILNLQALGLPLSPLHLSCLLYTSMAMWSITRLMMIILKKYSRRLWIMSENNEVGSD